MARARFRRREESRRNLVAKSLEIAEDLPSTKAHVRVDVFKEHEAGLNARKLSTHGRPKVARIAVRTASAARRERLARVARTAEIHASAPRAAVEGAKIVPNRSRTQRRRSHPRHEAGRRFGIALDVTHNLGSEAASSKGKSDAFAEHSGPGAEFEDREVIGT